MSTESNPKSSAAHDEACPLGTHDCPIYDQVQLLKVAHARLSQLSQTDPLTGLYNFRYLVSAVEREIERTRRTGSPTTLVMIDIDHFKSINDTYGHQVGNLALKHIAKLLKGSLRKIDIVCRYGGEEFTLILPNTRLSGGQLVAERMRERIEKSELISDDTKIALTASFGVGTFEEGMDLSGEAFIHEVDECLIRAKQKGRNQVQSVERKSIEGVSRQEKQSLNFDF